MVQISSFLAGLAILHLTTAAPTAVPLGATGKSLLISEDGTMASLDGRSIDLREAFKRDASCAPGMVGSGGGSGSGSGGAKANPKAIYFISNAANNSVVALKVAADGTLSDGTITPTGGMGMSGVDASGAPANIDGLFSQGSVKMAGNTLLAVNPGSNTVSMFTISPNNPCKLTMVGSPAPTLGDFPMSLSISAKLSTACVANSGANSGISCMSISAKGLTPLDKAQRPIPLGQSTPPSGPLNTISQTFFNADSTALMTTVKGNPMVNNTGFLSIFPVKNGCVSTNEIKTSPAGTAVLFGTALLPGKNNEVFATDASFGAATISLSANGTGSVASSAKIDGQKATCWATFSSTSNTAFVTDVGVNRLVEIDPSSGAIVKEYESQNGNLGMIDLEGKGNFVYALAPGNATAGRAASVSVWDVSGGKGAAKEVQNFMPKGVSDTVQGMAVL